MSKTYLGDSVYVEIEDGMIKLTTNNGYPDDPRNVIFMEPAVLNGFIQWLQHLKIADEPRKEAPTSGD
jgi:hypothetical protein